VIAKRVEEEKYTASMHASFPTDEKREQIKRMQAEYKHTPGKVLIYLAGPSLMVREAFVFSGEEAVRRQIDYLFQRCSEITLLKPDTLLGNLDFQESTKKDEEKDEEWFAALFAVMRTIVLLHESLGFETIEPLPVPPSKEKRKEADLKATRHGVTYAIEVCRTKEKVPWDHSAELGERIAKRYNGNKGVAGKKDGKKEQLRSTMNKYDCCRAVFVTAFDSFSCDIYDKQALWDAAEYAFAGMGLPDKTHVLIFTGVKRDETSKEDECWAIEPALPD
jgi:hypothetical protein